MSQHALDLVRSKGKLPARYGNFIGGNWIAPADGEYFTDYSPINGARLVDVAKSTARDVETALDAAHKAKDAWARMSPAERSLLLNKVADRMEEGYRQHHKVIRPKLNRPLRKVARSRR